MKRCTDLVLASAAIACVGLMIVRWLAAFHDGPYVITSGMEEESLFAIWKWMHGETVFANPYQPPFAQSYFNWLFYWTYGAFAAGVTFILKLGPSALPTVVRFLTILLTFATGIVVFGLLAPLDLFRRIAGSAVIAFNPLIGFWSVTARPDVAALLCDLAGLWCVKKAIRSGSVWLFPACAAFYGAWAFKQIFIAALACSCLYLFISGMRRQALLLGGGTAVAFAATLALGGKDFRYALIWSQSGMGLSVPLAIHNSSAALMKAPLLALGLIFILVTIRKARLDLFALTGLVSFVLFLLASGKSGASDNYFIEPAAMCSVVLLLGCAEWPLFAGALAQVVPVGLICVGLAGTLTAEPIMGLDLLRPKLANYTGPVIVTVNVANLPWFQETPPNFVLATTYPLDRRKGKPFSLGGVAGMIQSGRIKIVVCPRTQADKPFDGIVPSLSLRRIGEDSYWDYFETEAGK